MDIIHAALVSSGCRSILLLRIWLENNLKRSVLNTPIEIFSMKRSITTAFFLSLLIGLTAASARPLCDDDQVLNAVYQRLDETVGEGFGAKSYETLRVVTFATSPTHTSCMVKAGVIVNADSPLPPGVTLDVPYTLSGEGENTMLDVDIGGIVQGIDMNRLMQGM